MSEDKFEKAGKGHHYKNNHFFIFDDINEEFNDIILPAFIENVQSNLELKKPEPIHLYLKNYGGDLESCFEMISWIEFSKKNNGPIYTYVNSHVASSSSMIAVMGSRRFVSRRASHMLHYMISQDYTNSPELAQRVLKANLFYHKEIIHVYESNTKLNGIDEKLKTDYYILGGKELIKHGLADEIL